MQFLGVEANYSRDSGPIQPRFRSGTAAITGDSGRSAIPHMTHDSQLVCFCATNFERMHEAALRDDEQRIPQRRSAAAQKRAVSQALQP